MSLRDFGNTGRIFQSSSMETKKQIIFYLYIIVNVNCHELSSMSTKEVRTTGLLSKPEKFINGVIDIVQSHKNKPTQQGYAPNYQQYPAYQQFNYQNANNFQNQASFQNQGFSMQGQYGQGLANYQNGYNQISIPQGQTFIAPAQGFNTQSQNQQYQIVYQTIPSQGTQFQGNGQNLIGQTGQFSGNQVSNQPGPGQFQVGSGNFAGNSGQYHGGTGQYGTVGQFQGNSGQYVANNGQYQGSTGQYQGNNGQYQSSGLYQGNGNYHGSDGTQMNGQGFLVSGGQDGSQGQTCVCQTWTKPQPNRLGDPLPDKNEKTVDDTPQVRNLISF